MVIVIHIYLLKENTATEDADENNTNIKVILVNCAPLKHCITKIKIHK